MADFDSLKGRDLEDDKDPSIIEQATEKLLEDFNFMTIEETKEILYYKDGVYVTGGEILIEKQVQKMFRYQLKLKDLAEIKAQISRETYVKMDEIDANINTINLKNGLHDIDNDRLLNHTPAYYSINQKPITYDKDAKPKRFSSFLKEVLYPVDIRTAVDAMAYTFHRDYIVEVFYFLVGLGANGKSVFTKVITAMHGRSNVSNVSLKDITRNQYARSGLEHKDVNIDNEVSSEAIYDTAILKLLTAGILQPIRIERKYERAYDTSLYAKLFFNANSMPEINDNSNAYDRRMIPITFPNTFDGETADKHLVHKLTDETEMSGIFNVMMKALRRIRKNKDVYVNANERTIEEKTAKHERLANPVKAFRDEAIIISEPTDTVLKDVLYYAYSNYCKRYTLPIEKYNKFCGKMKKDFFFDDDRLGDAKDKNKKTSYWIGIRLLNYFSSNERQNRIDDNYDGYD